jgi:DNA-binding beta-propeller fold protein YncE
MNRRCFAFRAAIFLLGVAAVLPPARVAAQPAPVKAHSALIHCVAVSADGKLLATASFDNTVKIWEINPDGSIKDKEKKTLTGHTGPVYAVAFDPKDSNVVATASQDKTGRVWDISSGKVKAELKGHTDIVDTVAFSPDGKALATAGADKSVRLWNAADGKELKNLGAHDGSVYTVAFSPDGKFLASAGSGKDNAVKVWDVKGQKEFTQFKGHEQPVTSLVFAGNGELLTTSMDRTIREWKVEAAPVAPKEAKEPKDKKGPKDAKKSADKKDTAKKDKDKKEPKKEAAKEPKDVKDPRELKKLGPTTDDPYAIAWSPKVKLAAVCGYSGQVTVWALDSEKPKLTRAIKNPGYCIAFGADGKVVYTGHDNGTVAVTPIAGMLGPRAAAAARWPGVPAAARRAPATRPGPRATAGRRRRASARSRSRRRGTEAARVARPTASRTRRGGDKPSPLIGSARRGS